MRATAGARGVGAGAPCPQPVIPAAPYEMLKRHNANSFALWPPRRCHGAAAENKHNSPHVFSAPSTPRPSAPAPALAAQDLPRLCRTVPHCIHLRASETEPGFSPPALGKGSSGGTQPPSAPWSWFGGLARGTHAWQGDGEETEVWMGTAQGKGEERTRDAHTSPQTASPREVAHPITCTAAAQGRGKGTVSGRARAEQEPGYDTAWPVAPSRSRVETTMRG